MARLIVKSPYIKCGGGNSAGGYMRYIATRERVELIQDDRPPTRKQEQLIAKLVKDFPDARELDEYADYQEHPTKANASTFISQALEENWSDVQKSDGYMKYIAMRPRAERLGSHGLFGDKDGVELDRAMAELENYTGNVWTHIISLKREDAERLGYDNAGAWRTLLRAHRNDIAAAMNIPPQDFRWYAAFHDEGDHPHVHMMAWSAKPGQAYNGEVYFVDTIFALTDEQKGLAENYAENLSLFLGDGLFQYAPSTNTITALGDVRFTDGETEVIYFNQLDERYANQPYGTDHIGGYGCGPTSMAIVVSSLTSETVDPVQMARWAYEHGYWCSKSGSYHTLIPGAAQAWGLSVEGCTASEPQRILDALADGKLVVALMTKGHFTKSGHFIVLRGVQDGKILVADPASYRRSQKAWDLSIILNEASKRAGAGGPFWIIG